MSLRSSSQQPPGKSNECNQNQPETISLEQKVVRSTEGFQTNEFEKSLTNYITT